MEKNTLYKNHGLFQDGHVEKFLSKQMIDKLLDDYIEHGPVFRRGFNKGKEWGRKLKPTNEKTRQVLMAAYSTIQGWVKSGQINEREVLDAKLLLNDMLKEIQGYD